jgi:hypothetical protein
MEHTTEMEKHQHEITQKKEEPNSITTSKTQNIKTALLNIHKKHS